MHKYTNLRGDVVTFHCPVLININVAIKRFDLDAKRIDNIDKQRQRRADAKHLKIAAGATADQLTGKLSKPLEGLALPSAVPAKIQRLADVWANYEEPSTASIRAKKKGKNGGELPLDTLDVTPPLLKEQKLLEGQRIQCKKTGSFLQKRETVAGVLHKAGSKILNCSLWGLFQAVTPQVNYKVGTALCKNRLCPNCQRVLSAKRKNNSLDWWELNKKKLSKYFFYHAVFTVRHSAAEGVRCGLYTPDLLRYFAELRGTSSTLSGAAQRSRSSRWKHFVAGGSYSVEVKPGRDGSPNIHIHCLLVGNVFLSNRAKDSEFLSYAKGAWEEITGDSNGVFVAPVYFRDDAGKEVYCHKGTDVRIDRAVAECMKYTIKSDTESLQGFSNEFLTDLLTFRNRYYGRFGCLSSNDKTSKQFLQMEMLTTDYKDLEQLTRAELARLYNPETGEVVLAENTQFVATPFRNMIPKENKPTPGVLPSLGAGEVQQLGRVVVDEKGNVLSKEVLGTAERQKSLGGETYYEATPLPNHLAVSQYKFFPYHEKDRAAIALSRSISESYNERYEFDAVLNPVPRKKQAPQRAQRGVNNFKTSKNDTVKNSKKTGVSR